MKVLGLIRSHRGLLARLLLISLSCTTNAQSREYTESLAPGVLVGPELNRDAALPAVSDGSCPTGYEKVPGTDFCLQPKISLTREAKNFLADQSSEPDCKKGFSRPREHSTLCLDNRLALTWSENALTLALQQCPQGFAEAETVTGCVAEEEIMPPASTVRSRCKPGYMTVENLNVCIANDVVIKTGRDVNFGIWPSDTVCDHGRKRIREGGFCIPARTLTNCDADLALCTKENTSTLCLIPNEDADCCPQENLSVHEIPQFNGDAFTTEEVFSCTLGPGSVIPKCDMFNLDLTSH